MVQFKLDDASDGEAKVDTTLSNMPRAPDIYYQTCEPGNPPFNNDKSYHKWLVTFRFSTQVRGCRIGRGDWTAWMTFFMKDIAEMMREGLYWSPQNCIPELSFLSKTDLSSQEKAEGGVIARGYELVDNLGRWHAVVRVVARDSLTLKKFRLEQLAKERMSWCRAINSGKDTVYEWKAHGPTCDNINTIYDDIPLEGWWPWPKPKPCNTDELD